MCAGILALDSELPGCAEFCVAPEYCLGKNSISLGRQKVVVVEVVVVVEKEEEEEEEEEVY